jgi:hypothetical protein
LEGAGGQQRSQLLHGKRHTEDPDGIELVIDAQFVWKAEQHIEA